MVMEPEYYFFYRSNSINVITQMKSHQKYSHLQENEDADVYLLTRKSIQDRVQR